jgi:hypothetical protein
MATTITFLVDTHALPAPGTFKNPAWTQHFPTIVSQNGGAPVQYTSDQTVRAGKGDQIDIALVDASLGPAVVLAPVMLLAHAWGSDPNNLPALKPSDLADSNPKKPIDKPRFDVNHAGMPKMQYAGSESNWQQVQQSDHLSWSDGAKITEDVSASSDTVYGPYVTFTFQGYPGILEYGVEFSVSTDGKTVGYYYFDPRIQVA